MEGTLSPEDDNGGAVTVKGDPHRGNLQYDLCKKRMEWILLTRSFNRIVSKRKNGVSRSRHISRWRQKLAIEKL